MQRIPLSDLPELDIDPQWSVIRLPAQQFAMLHNFIYADTRAMACLDTLRKMLLSGSIRVRKKFFKASALFQRVLDTSWKKYAFDVIMSYQTYGFVISALRADRTPFVWDPCTLDVSVMRHVDTLDYRYRVFPRQRNPMDDPTKPLTNAMVFEANQPTESGQLTSPVRTIFQIAAYTYSMMAFSIRAQERLAVPPLVTEKQEQKIDQKRFTHDYHLQGDNTAIYQQALGEASAMNVTLAEDREWRARSVNAGMGNSGIAIDPVNGQPRYTADIRGFHNINIPLEDGRKLVRTDQSSSPPFLMELLGQYEQDVGKVFGVPAGLWGSQRSAVAADLTLVYMLNATLQYHRCCLQLIMGEMLEWAHGKANLVHAGWHYDPTKTDKDNYDASRWDISFPGLLDAETINTLLMNGFMSYEKLKPYISCYYGIPEDELAPERLDPMTERPIHEVAEAQLQQEKQSASLEKKRAEVDIAQKKQQMEADRKTDQNKRKTQQAAVTRSHNIKRQKHDKPGMVKLSLQAPLA